MAFERLQKLGEEKFGAIIKRTDDRHARYGHGPQSPAGLGRHDRCRFECGGPCTERDIVADWYWCQPCAEKSLDEYEKKYGKIEPLGTDFYGAFE